MELRQLGRSGIGVSPVALGTWAVGGGPWWGASNDEESIAAIRAALDAGVNLVDTAPIYYFGHSERVVGRALKDGYREKAVVATKCGLPWFTDAPGPLWFEQDGRCVVSCCQAPFIRREIEDSLRNLGVDVIDLYQLHLPQQPGLEVPVDETMGVLQDLRREGKIRAVGVSNVTVPQLKDYLACGVVDTVQNKYSMLDRAAEVDVLPFCREHGIAFLGYQPLEQGLLTGKIRPETELAPGSFRNAIKWYEPAWRGRICAMLDGWSDLTAKYDCTTAQLVIAWTAAQPGVTSVLCGARKVRNAAENARAAEISLESADLARMRADVERLNG